MTGTCIGIKNLKIIHLGVNKCIGWIKEDDMFKDYMQDTRFEYNILKNNLKDYHIDGLCGSSGEHTNNEIKFGKCTGCKLSYTHNMEFIPDYYYFSPFTFIHHYFNANIHVEKYLLGDDGIILSFESNYLNIPILHKFIRKGTVL